MGFLNRLSNLAKADAHGVLDALEDRSLTLKQCLREAEFELEQKRDACDELAQREERVRKDLTRVAGKLAELEADIELAMQQDNEELSHFSVRRFLLQQKRRNELEEKLPSLREERERLAQECSIQEDELSALEERVRQHLSASRCEPGAETSLVEGTICEEEIELEILRRRSAARVQASPLGREEVK